MIVHSRPQDQERIAHPNPFDVLLGRGRWYSAHAGNRRLQIFINMNLDRYQNSRDRREKTSLTLEILKMTKICGQYPGRFLKLNDSFDSWCEVPDYIARLKISQAIRYTLRCPPQGGIITPAMVALVEEEENTMRAGRSSSGHRPFRGNGTKLCEDTSSSPEKVASAKFPAPIHSEKSERIMSCGNKSGHKLTSFPKLGHKVISEEGSGTMAISDQVNSRIESSQLLLDEEILSLSSKSGDSSNENVILASFLSTEDNSESKKIGSVL